MKNIKASWQAVSRGKAALPCPASFKIHLGLREVPGTTALAEVISTPWPSPTGISQRKESEETGKVYT
jgi:hypothetical protein